MPNEKENKLRMQLIDYIVENDKSFENKNFENYSITQLIILKTKIEAKLSHKRKPSKK